MFSRLSLSMLLLILVVSCDGSSGSSGGDLGNGNSGENASISSFALSTDAVDVGDNFTINMGGTFGFDAKVLINEVGLTTVGILYSATSEQGLINSLTIDYDGLKFTSKQVPINLPITTGEYELYLRLCNSATDNSSCVVSEKVKIKLNDPTVHFGYYLKNSTDKYYYTGRSLSYDVKLIKNTSALEQTYTFFPEDGDVVNTFFEGSFLDKELDRNSSFKLAPGESNRLRIKPGTALSTLSDRTYERTYILTEGDKIKRYIYSVNIVTVAHGGCTDGEINLTTCRNDNLTYLLDNTTPLGGIVFSEAELNWFRDIRATLTLSSTIFDFFEVDSRTTCEIKRQSGSGIISRDKPCFLFLKKKAVGSGSLVISGFEEGTSNPMAVSIKFNAVD